MRGANSGEWSRPAREDDGAVEAEFVLSSTEEVKSWVLSFGRHAEVLSPRELREEMREEWAAMGERYAEAGRKW